MPAADFDAFGRVAELRYPVPPQWSGPADDLTPCVDAEDFDLGLFIADVLAGRDRAARIYR
ncbi:hypothetical protein ACFVXG_24410 [Kitasatospora sp. NPDC058162]|uniref:hypothetical protein n=1 Tax=Kitasatospora sp. NPDC058162 TaxID=3346362 RepID=UPI0036DDD0CE